MYEPARVVTRLKAEASAKLAWLPQETIVFNGARLHRTTEIELFSGAELLALEWLVLGRTAHGEVVVGGNLTDSWRVKRDGRLIWADNFRITDEILPHLNRKALLANGKAVATLIYFGPYLEKRLDFLREIIPSLGCNCAATLVSGLIVVRFAAKKSSDLKFALRSFLEQFGPELGAGPFRGEEEEENAYLSSQGRRLLVGRWIQRPSTVKRCSRQKQSRRRKACHGPTKE
jgi:urease accessory protein